MTFHDRYRAAGLTHNPFAAWQPGDPPTTAFVDRGLPDPPAPGSRTLVQVIGESGHGKSTQLNHWRSAAPGQHHYIPRDPYRGRWASPPPPAASNNIIYGDEIDRMPALLRSRWFRELALSGTTLVIGTHVDLSRLGDRCGFAVVTHALSPANRSLIQRVVEARLQSASIENGQPPRFSGADIDLVARKSRGVLREADVLCHKILSDLVS